MAPPGSHRYTVFSLGRVVMHHFFNALLSYGLGQIVPRDSTTKMTHGYSPEALVALPLSDLLTSQRAHDNPVRSVAAHSIRILRVRGLPGEILSQGTGKQHYHPCP